LSGRELISRQTRIDELRMNEGFEKARVELEWLRVVERI